MLAYCDQPRDQQRPRAALKLEFSVSSGVFGVIELRFKVLQPLKASNSRCHLYVYHLRHLNHPKTIHAVQRRSEFQCQLACK